MKFEYLYVVFFVLSLVYKWYKSTKENVESDQHDSPENQSQEVFDEPLKPGSFEDLISQFEAAYGDDKVNDSKVVVEEEVKVAEPEKMPEPKVNWYKEETASESTTVQTQTQTEEVAQMTDIAGDESENSHVFDLEQMVIASTILDRPYQ